MLAGLFRAQSTKLRTLSVAVRAESMLAAVLNHEKPLDLQLKQCEITEPLLDRDVRIDVCSVGICGSDMEYFKHNRIGNFIMKQPMILGHEAAGIVTEVGKGVTHLKVGDRVCMEPGVPDPFGKATRLGIYNVDQELRFWATPPPDYAKRLNLDSNWNAGHGCLRPSVVHAADFTFKIPDHVSMDEAAMVEPLSVGMHACTLAGIKPGDVAVITGAGPIGMLAAMAALASGCSKVFIADINPVKTAVAETLAPKGQIIGIPLDSDPKALLNTVKKETDDWGVPFLFECSGHPSAYTYMDQIVAPSGTAVLVGCPGDVTMDIGKFQGKEITLKPVFRYRHVYPQAVALLGSGAIDVKPIITNHFEFDQTVEAFNYMLKPTQHTIKSVIHVKHE